VRRSRPDALVYRLSPRTALTPDEVAICTYLETERLERRTLWSSPGKPVPTKPYRGLRSPLAE
jgi:hypothetical protein